MYKYIEELHSGESFEFNKGVYTLTTDYKKDGKKLAVSHSDGSLRWINQDEMIVPVDVYKIDAENTIVKIRESSDEKNATYPNVLKTGNIS
jgi:hypothetical protein